jgi:hypothetical protein
MHPVAQVRQLKRTPGQTRRPPPPRHPPEPHLTHHTRGAGPAEAAVSVTRRRRSYFRPVSLTCHRGGVDIRLPRTRAGVGDGGTLAEPRKHKSHGDPHVHHSLPDHAPCDRGVVGRSEVTSAPTCLLRCGKSLGGPGQSAEVSRRLSAVARYSSRPYEQHHGRQEPDERHNGKNPNRAGPPIAHSKPPDPTLIAATTTDRSRTAGGGPTGTSSSSSGRTAR